MASSHDEDPIIELLNTEDDFTTDDHRLTKPDYYSTTGAKNSDLNNDNDVDHIINREGHKSDPFEIQTPTNINHTYVNTPLLPQHQLYEVFDDAEMNQGNNRSNNGHDSGVNHVGNKIDELSSNGSTSYDNSLLAPINDFISHSNNQLTLSASNKSYLSQLPPLSPLSESVIPNGLSIQPLTLPIINNDQNQPDQPQSQSQSQSQQHLPPPPVKTTTSLLPPTTANATKRIKKEPTGPKTRPLFVTKLWSMVNDPNNDKYIRWNESGKTFQVYHREEFMRNVLPKYFKHNNFASFVRQLNMYGWHKVQDINSGTMSNGTMNSVTNGESGPVSDDEILQFENPNFIRGQEELLDKIVRNKPTTHANQDEQGGNNLNVLNNSTTNTINQINFQILINELDQIKMNQLAISEDLRRIRKDNKTLWNENFMARERHSTQAQTLDKILTFLSSMYGNNNATGKILEVDDIPFNHNINTKVGGGDNSVNDLYNDLNNVNPQASSSSATQPFSKPRLMLMQEAYKQSPKSSSSNSSTRHNSTNTSKTTGDSRQSVAESSTGSIEEIIRSYGNTPSSNNHANSNNNVNRNRPSNESIENANRIYQQIINQEPVPITATTSNNNINSNLVSSPRHFYPELNSNVNSPSPYLGNSINAVNSNSYMRIDEPVPNSADVITGLEQNIYRQGQSIQQVQDWIQKLAQQQEQLQQQQQQEQRRHSQIVEEDEDEEIMKSNSNSDTQGKIHNDVEEDQVINSGGSDVPADEFDVNEFLNSTQPLNPSSEGDVMTPNSVVNIDLTDGNNTNVNNNNNNNNNNSRNNYGSSKRSIEEVYDHNNNTNSNDNNLRSNQRRKVNRKG